jgi:hypothetical protein
MGTPAQDAATQEMNTAVKGAEDQSKAANSAAADAAAEAHAGNAPKAAADAAAAQSAADGAWDQYRAAKGVYNDKKALFPESGLIQDELRSQVLLAYQRALEAQDDADRAKLDSVRASRAPKAVIDVGKDVLRKRRDARKKFLEAATEADAAEGLRDKASRRRAAGDGGEAKRLTKKASNASQRETDARAKARQLRTEAQDLDGAPATFHLFPAEER